MKFDSKRPAHRANALIRSVAWAAGAFLVVTAGYAGTPYTDLRKLEPIHGDAQAGAGKAAVCLGCHGADGVSVAPTFPRLAGQRVDYLYHRLASFRHANPKDPYYSVSPMTAIAAGLSDTDMRDLAAYFATQIPRVPDAPGAASPITAPAAAVASHVAIDSSTPMGERLFLNGEPARGIPPCQGCHGADANGPSSASNQYAAYPALRGQYAPYVTARLTHYRDGQPSDTSNTFIMHGVAATLDDASIQAIADWLVSLAPKKSL